MNILDSVPSEAKCRSIVRRALFGCRPYCPACLSSRVSACGGRYRCLSCRRKFSLTSASFLRRMRVPYRTLFLVLACWQRKVPFGLAVSLSGASAPTVRRYMRLFRERLPSIPEEFFGVVEVDEAFFGRRRHGSQKIVVGMVERRTGKVALRIVPRRDDEQTDSFILDHAFGGSVVCTDGAACYVGIDRFWGYRHVACNHSAFVFGPTNRIEAVWSSLKRFLRRTVGRPTSKFLPEILREFECRKNEPSLFDSPLSYLETCLTLVPLACS